MSSQHNSVGIKAWIADYRVVGLNPAQCDQDMNLMHWWSITSKNSKCKGWPKCCSKVVAPTIMYAAQLYVSQEIENVLVLKYPMTLSTVYNPLNCILYFEHLNFLFQVLVLVFCWFVVHLCSYRRNMIFVGCIFYCVHIIVKCTLHVW